MSEPPDAPAPAPSAPAPNAKGAFRLFRGFVLVNMALLAIVAALVVRALR